MKNKQPIGITIFGSAIIAISVLLLGHLVIALSFLKGVHPAELVYFLIAILLGNVGIFIIKRKNLARILFLWLMGAWWVVTSYVFYIIVRYHPVPMPKETTLASILFQYFCFALPSLVSVFYLTRSEVKKQFR